VGDAHEEGAERRDLRVLLPAGGLLLLWCLFLNRIALGGPLGAAPGWVEALALPFDRAWSALVGPLAADVWEVTGQRVRVTQFVVGTALASLVYLLVAAAVARGRLRVSERGYTVILVVAICGRLLPVASPPLLETDAYRYLWDGVAAQTGVNPYRYPPGRVLDLALGAPLDPGAPGAAELRPLCPAAGASPGRTGLPAESRYWTAIAAPVW